MNSKRIVGELWGNCEETVWELSVSCRGNVGEMLEPCGGKRALADELIDDEWYPKFVRAAAEQWGQLVVDAARGAPLPFQEITASDLPGLKFSNM